MDKDTLEHIENSIYNRRLVSVYSHDTPGVRLLFYYVAVHVITDHRMTFTVNRINARGHDLNLKGWKQFVEEGNKSRLELTLGIF